MNVQQKTPKSSSAVFRTNKVLDALMNLEEVNPIQYSQTVPISGIAGVVCAKPNVTQFPVVTCKFYQMTGFNNSSTTVADIYSFAGGSLTGGADAYHGDWGSLAVKTALDVDLHHFGFAHGQNVAIAFNLDTAVNGGVGSTYDYSFYYDNAASFEPNQAIVESGGTSSLKWIYGDDFQGGVNSGVGGTSAGRTVIVVCPVITGANPHFISFNLSVLGIKRADALDQMPAMFDPKIKNNG